MNKEQLLEEKLKIESTLNRIGQKTSETGDWIVRPDAGDGVHADAVDNADITEDYEEKIAVLKVLEEQLQSIDAALAALEE